MEKNNIKGAVTLRNIVENVKNDINEFSNRNDKRFLQFAIRGAKELRLFHLNVATSKLLPVSDINTITLPDDFISFLSLGVAYKGKLWTFTENRLIITPKTVDCGIEELDITEGEGVNIAKGGTIDGYGTTGGKNSYYIKKDFDNNRIIISGFTLSQAILTYISTGVSLTEETYVPAIAQESMIAWVHWRRQQHNKDASRVDKQEAKYDYEQEIDKLRLAQSPTIDEWYDAIYSTLKQTVKR